jgi:hypothetical protein
MTWRGHDESDANDPIRKLSGRKERLNLLQEPLLGAAGIPRQLRPFPNGQRHVVFVPPRAQHDRSHPVRPDRKGSIE